MDFELLCHPATAAAVPGRAAAATAAAATTAHYEKFQSWANENYGENSKSKTVTRQKYWRIVRCLAGDERSSADNAKFRFWIKAKGFRLGLAGGGWGALGAGAVHHHHQQQQELYVPTKVQTLRGIVKEYRRVAIVEDFFSIIHSMHVDRESRTGKHAGQ